MKTKFLIFCIWSKPLSFHYSPQRFSDIQVWRIGRYIEQEDTREVIDIRKLNAEIVKRENELRKAIDAIVNDLENGKNEQIDIKC